MGDFASFLSHNVRKKQVHFKICPDLTEDFNSIKTPLDALKYDEFGLGFIRDFKMVVFLMGFQGSFT